LSRPLAGAVASGKIRAEGRVDDGRGARIQSTISETVRPMLAMELIPRIRQMLAELESENDPVASGRRAALWRAQQHAAALNHTVDDLRRYCLEALSPRRVLDEEDQMRGYREGFQAVLAEVRRFEARRRAA
jgi:hypothetical protein